jgi:hypothetical protein
MACPLADLARVDIAGATAAVAADDSETEVDDHPGSPSSVCACNPACRGSKLPVPPTTKRMAFRVAQRSLAPINVRRVSQVHGASVEGRTWLWYTPKDGLDMRLRCAADTLNQGVCVWARPSASDALETEMWELCREIPLPEAEAELSFREGAEGAADPHEGSHTAIA